jgi:predicted  nucleic acid-binding Zn-ribbon protein
MAITRQLYQLQELDTEIENEEQSLKRKESLIGKRDVLEAAQARLDAAQKQLDELKRRHKDAEMEVDDVLGNIADIEKKLYGGTVTNPKELSSLQHEVTTMKARNDELENKALEIIDQAEEAEQVVAADRSEYQKLENDWQQQQRQLTDEISQLKNSLSKLRDERQQLAGQIDSQTLNLYEKIRQQKKQAVAKVEQGICHACHISQSASVIQRARSGHPVQCGTCGRILFIS